MVNMSIIAAKDFKINMKFKVSFQVLKIFFGSKLIKEFHISFRQKNVFHFSVYLALNEKKT